MINGIVRDNCIITSHNHGFFSCCSVILHNIIEYINLNKKLPLSNSSNSFGWYKKENRDITYEYFENININQYIQDEIKPIDYKESYQFNDYSNLDYNVTKIVEKYFIPSLQIKEIINTMEAKYIIDYNNICVLFYRGNDKITETKLCEYNDYLIYANQIIYHNPNVVFLIQSDETEFIQFMTIRFPNSFYFKDETRHMNKCNSTVDHVMHHTNDVFSKYYLAITIIMSKCKYIVCGSGNCSLWIILYRGNNRNVCQYLNGTWYQTLEQIKVKNSLDEISILDLLNKQSV
jgi:carboxypeptidase C (cathepsin A)